MPQATRFKPAALISRGNAAQERGAASFAGQFEVTRTPAIRPNLWFQGFDASALPTTGSIAPMRSNIAQ